MRVLVVAAGAGDMLTPRHAAATVRDSWLAVHGAHHLDALPLTDGGDGFVETMHAALGGELELMTVTGAHGARQPAAVLLVPDPATGSRVAYVEPTQLSPPRAGEAPPRLRHRVLDTDETAARQSSYGIGEVLAHAGTIADRVVVGLGPRGVLDGGAGMLAALGAVADPQESLLRGAEGLGDLLSVDLTSARERVRGTELTMLTDVEETLLGLRGATNVHGPRHGLDPERRFEVDGFLTRLAHAVDRSCADTPGSGAAGGLGFGLLALGASHGTAVATVLDLTGARRLVERADLVVVATPHVGPHEIDGGVVGGVAEVCQEHARPLVVLAATGDVSPREHRAAGIDAVYLGSEGSAPGEGEDEALARAARRAAGTWGRRGT